MSARASQVRSALTPVRSLRIVGRRNRRLVKRAGAGKMAPAIVIAAILIAATTFGVLLSQVVIAQSGFKMQKLREEVVEAEEQHARLVLKAAKLSSAERIERVAVEELGMVFPQNAPEYIVANVKTRSSRRLSQVAQEPLVAPSDPAAALGGTAP